MGFVHHVLFYWTHNVLGDIQTFKSLLTTKRDSSLMPVAYIIKVNNNNNGQKGLYWAVHISLTISYVNNDNQIGNEVER